MNKLLGILALVAALALPTIAQVQSMTSDDEAKFDGYYQRWQQDRQNNDRDDMVDMEHHMQDIMNKYAIPPDTPYDQVASRSGAYPAQNPNYDHDHYRGYANQWQNRLSPDDQ